MISNLGCINYLIIICIGSQDYLTNVSNYPHHFFMNITAILIQCTIEYETTIMNNSLASFLNII